MKKLFATAILSAVYLILAGQMAWAQGALTVTTDKAQYDYGEVIEISVTVSNPTDETFQRVGSSSCEAQFKFNDFDSLENTICTADAFPTVFPPGSKRTWIWRIDPAAIGLPSQPGPHAVIGYYPPTELADTIAIDAPRFLGGILAVGLQQNVSPDDVASIRDSLNVEVLESWETERGLAEKWQISGVAVDSAVAWYGADERFRYFEAVRRIEYHQIVSAEDVPEVASSAKLISAHPNPFTDSFAFGLELAHPQHVRVAIYDVLGREVAVLHRGILHGGPQQFSFESGLLANGLYVYQVEGESFSLAGKVLLAR